MGQKAKKQNMMYLPQLSYATVLLAPFVVLAHASEAAQAVETGSSLQDRPHYMAEHAAASMESFEPAFGAGFFVVAQAREMRPDILDLRTQAEEGDPAAQLALGTAFALGRGLERDEQRAVSWLTQAAEGGNITAQYNLAILDVARGAFADAYHWFVIVAERGRGEIQTKATRNRQLLSSVLTTDNLKIAKRDAGDWIEEFAVNPSANSATDQELEFIGLPVPKAGGWREMAAALQNAARDSLGMPH